MIDSILSEASEEMIRDRVEEPLNEWRIRYPFQRTRVRDPAEFWAIVGHVVQAAYFHAITPGGRPAMHQAVGIARDLLDHGGRRQGKTVNSFIHDSIHGLDGGLPAVYPILFEGLRSEGTRRYLDDVIDRHIPSNDFALQTQAVREVAERFGDLLPRQFREARPEASAAHYREVLQAIFEAQREAARNYRRL